MLGVKCYKKLQLFRQEYCLPTAVTQGIVAVSAAEVFIFFYGF